MNKWKIEFYQSSRSKPIVYDWFLQQKPKVISTKESTRFAGASSDIRYQSSELNSQDFGKTFLENHLIEHPKRAGKKIWGEELVEVEFKESNNCKEPRWR